MMMPDAYPSSSSAAAAARAPPLPRPDSATATAATAQPQQQPPQHQSRVLFSCCKGETHTHRSGFKQLHRRLRVAGYRAGKLESLDDLRSAAAGLPAGPRAAATAAADGASSSGRHNQCEHEPQPPPPPPIVVLGCPTAPFTEAECDALESVLAAGGGLLVMLRDGGERAAGTNLNYLLERHGIAAAKDAVLRATYDAYPHPREARVVDGVVNRALLVCAAPNTINSSGDQAGGGGSGAGAQAPEASKPGMGALPFVYPYGCSLAVQRPAVPLLSSGCVCYPVQRPLMAAWEAPRTAAGGGGRLLVVGTAQVFGDAWLDREANARIADWAFAWLARGSRALPLHAGDAAAPDIAEPRPLPDIEALAGRPKPCLFDDAAARPALPRDWTRLFDRARAGARRTALVPEAAALYARLNVPKAPLALIAPSLDAPLPALTGAVFPVAPRCPPPPPLELFDLDAALAPPCARLAAACAQAIDDAEAAVAAATVNKARGRQHAALDVAGGGGAGDEDADADGDRDEGGNGNGSANGGSAPELEAFLLDAASAYGLEVAEQTGKGVLSALLREMLAYRSSGSGGDDDGAGLAAPLGADADEAAVAALAPQGASGGGGDDGAPRFVAA